jgi:hypothetical protein
MSDCPFTDHYRTDAAGICVSSTCPAREDCPGIDPAPDPSPLDAMEWRMRAMERQLSELRAALGRWVEGVEGGDRGRD